MAEPLRGTQLTARALDVEAPVRPPVLRLLCFSVFLYAQGAGDFFLPAETATWRMLLSNDPCCAPGAPCGGNRTAC